MSRISKLLILLSAMASFMFSQTTIAVLDLDINNVSQSDVRALSDRLREELFKTKKYKVLERGLMEEIMKEQGFQQAGCTSNECIVEVGQLTGVQKMVGGSVSKVGSVYSVSCRIIDVETGEIIKMSSYDHIGDMGGLLTQGMRMVANELSTGSIPQSILPQAASRAGKLYITTVPSGASVVIGNISQGVSPLTIDIEEGTHKMILSYDGYERIKKAVTVYPDSTVTIKKSLIPLSRKTASRRAWLFPGLGHFYAKKVQRGLFWSALEMVSLYGMYALYDNYQAKETEYNKARDEYLAAESHDEINLKKKIYDTAFAEKNTALYALGGMGTVTAGVWIWNVFDVRNAIPRGLPMPKDSKLKFGFNTSGELSVQLEF